MRSLDYAESPADDLALLVSPGTGCFRRLGGQRVVIETGGMFGRVTGPGCSAGVTSPADAVVIGTLVRSGEVVQAGQVIAWGRRCQLEALA